MKLSLQPAQGRSSRNYSRKHLARRRYSSLSRRASDYVGAQTNSSDLSSFWFAGESASVSGGNGGWASSDPRNGLFLLYQSSIAGEEGDTEFEILFYRDGLVISRSYFGGRVSYGRGLARSKTRAALQAALSRNRVLIPCSQELDAILDAVEVALARIPLNDIVSTVP